MAKILGIAGSLRKGSYNRGALRAAQEEAPDDSELEIFQLNQVPLFNQDIELPVPQPVKEFKDKIETSDAILFATPEYNGSVSGVLKNAIDWGSRPPGENSWEGKPCAIISASPGMLGGVKAQYHLRQSMVFLGLYPLNRPEVFIGGAGHKFDEQGNLTDEDTKKRINRLLKALVVWTNKLV